MEKTTRPVKPVRHTATYFQHEVYFVTDKSAGALCRAIGEKVPPHGSKTQIKLRVGQRKLVAMLMRAEVPTGVPYMGVPSYRGWVWTLSNLRNESDNAHAKVNSSFKFMIDAKDSGEPTIYPLSSDARYTIVHESYGAGVQSYVLRFDGEFVMSSPFLASALTRAVGENARRRGALVVTEIPAQS